MVREGIPGLSLGELGLIQTAYWLAEKTHEGQIRDSGEPYLQHPIGVASLLLKHGACTHTAVIKALLHDVFEDTDTPPFIAISLFGEQMLHSFYILSIRWPILDVKTGELVEHQKKDMDAYYATILTAEHEDRLVKLADRLHNLRTMQSWTKERRREYARMTEKRILPIADRVSRRFAREIREIIEPILTDANE